MVRTIKFRGKDVKTDKWRYGYFAIHHITEKNNHDELLGYKEVPSIFNDEPGERGKCGYWHEVQGNSVGQFTGMRDMDGQEIYEGDIIRLDVCGDGTHGVVVYDAEHAMFAMKYDDPYNPITYGLYDCQEKELEVLGNIHDNPELLKRTTN